MSNISQQAAVSIDTPKIATVPRADDNRPSAAAKTRAAGVLQVETSDKTAPSVFGGEVGQAPRLDRQNSQPMPGQLQKTLSSVEGLGRFHNIDLTAILAVLIVLEAKVYKAERQERAAHLVSQLSYLKKKAASLRDQGLDQLIGGVVKGAMEIGSGVVRGVGGVKSARAVKGSDKTTSQELMARTQSIQMRYGAVADMTSAGGDMAASSSSYLAKQEESAQTKEDAGSQFEGSQASFSSESAGRFWGVGQNIISVLQESIRGNHEATRASFY